MERVTFIITIKKKKKTRTKEEITKNSRNSANPFLKTNTIISHNT